jgi:hypothetical protein
MRKSKPTVTKLYRQGDVLFRRLRRLPTGKRTKRENGIIAFGEVTGHSHSLAVEDRDVGEVLEMGARLFVHVRRSDRGGVSVVHDEHAPVTLPAGNFEVIIQREYTPEKIRPVAD